MSDYSTTVIRAHPSRHTATTQQPALSSILTIRASPNPNETPDQVLPGTAHSPAPSDADPLGTSSIFSIASIDSYHTAHTASAISSAFATEGGSTIRSLHGNYVVPLVHRFTLIKPGAKPKKNSISGTLTPNGGESAAVGWNPLDLIFSSALLVAKCDVCNKRLGWRPVLECDDCGLRFVIRTSLCSPFSSSFQGACCVRGDSPSGLWYSSLTTWYPPLPPLQSQASPSNTSEEQDQNQPVTGRVS